MRSGSHVQLVALRNRDLELQTTSLKRQVVMVQFLSIKFFSWISSIFVGFFKSSRFFVSPCSFFTTMTDQIFLIETEFFFCCTVQNESSDIIQVTQSLNMFQFQAFGAGFIYFFFNFSTFCIQNVNNTGTKQVRIMKQTAF